MKIEYIKEYVVLSEILNFTKAAESLFITQPALSRHISIIEEEMGTVLLRRDTKNVSLTPAGQAVYERFRDILALYQKAQTEAGPIAGKQYGTLKISCPHFWLEEYLEPILMKFTAEFPNIEVITDTYPVTQGYCAMYDGAYDLALMHDSSIKVKRVQKKKFVRERLVCMMRADNPLAMRDAIEIEELNGEIFVNYGTEHSEDLEHKILLDGAYVIDCLLAIHGVKPKKQLYVRHPDMVGLKISQSGGVSIAVNGQRRIDRKYLKMVPFMNEDCFTDLCFYYREDNTNDALLLFLKCVREVFPTK